MSKRSLINGKVYLSCDKIGDNYFECFYCFFREGSIVRTGVEDFSLERLKSCTKLYNVRIFKGPCGSSGRRYTDSTNCYLLADKSVTMASLSRYIVDNDELFGFARLERCYSGYATNLFQFSSAWGAFVARIEEYPEKIADCTNDITEDTKDVTEDAKKDIANTDIDDTEKYTVCLGSLDGIQIDTSQESRHKVKPLKVSNPHVFGVIVVGSGLFDCRFKIITGSCEGWDCRYDVYKRYSFNRPLLPVPRWFFQRSNIYAWSAVLAAYKCWYYCDRRKRVIVKPVRISPRGCYPVRVSPYGMPSDFYPYKMFVDGLEMWDCRSRSYNEYLSDLIGAPPYDELPF